MHRVAQTAKGKEKNIEQDRAPRGANEVSTVEQVRYVVAIYIKTTLANLQYSIAVAFLLA